mmetsp:Transcript_32284/g.80407  ORF Transcript_32284/g.80407 Transcript_32284/m.80407 type:complete len:540 (+) Transcript_32284:1105-2724(+)
MPVTIPATFSAAAARVSSRRAAVRSVNKVFESDPSAALSSLSRAAAEAAARAPSGSWPRSSALAVFAPLFKPSAPPASCIACSSRVAGIARRTLSTAVESMSRTARASCTADAWTAIALPAPPFAPASDDAAKCCLAANRAIARVGGLRASAVDLKPPNRKLISRSAVNAASALRSAPEGSRVLRASGSAGAAPRAVACASKRAEATRPLPTCSASHIAKSVLSASARARVAAGSAKLGNDCWSPEWAGMARAIVSRRGGTSKAGRRRALCESACAAVALSSVISRLRAAAPTSASALDNATSSIAAPARRTETPLARCTVALPLPGFDSSLVACSSAALRSAGFEDARYSAAASPNTARTNLVASASAPPRLLAAIGSGKSASASRASPPYPAVTSPPIPAVTSAVTTGAEPTCGGTSETASVALASASTASRAFASLVSAASPPPALPSRRNNPANAASLLPSSDEANGITATDTTTAASATVAGGGKVCAKLATGVGGGFTAGCLVYTGLPRYVASSQHACSRSASISLLIESAAP